MQRTRSGAKRIKPWGAQKAVSIRSLQPWWMGSGEQSVSVSRQASSMIFGPAHRFSLIWKGDGQSRTALFDSNRLLRRALGSTAAFNCLPPCSRRRTPIRFDRQLYRHRHVVENFFSRIKRHRRIATRYEKLAVTFHGFVCFAAVLDWFNHEI